MTKRAYPFDNYLSRQLKVHLNDYENCEKTLKEIQERTLHKLLDGSKKFYLNACKNEEYQGSDVNSIRSSENCKKFMQKRVTNYFAVNGKLNEISCKNLISSTGASRCSFCDSNTNLLHSCTKCRELYCGSCTFINYSTLDESRICMSCS